MIADVATVIVNHNTALLTLAAVESVLAEPETAEVIVVDAASKPQDVATLASQLRGDPRVHLVQHPVNCGFGAACNRGSHAALAPYLFLLNSDATTREGCLGRLRHALQSSPRTGLVGPRVRTSRGTEDQVDACGRFPTPWRLLTRRLRAPVDALKPDWISGVAILARREEFLRLGGFDEEFFLYLEDVDLCRRYRAAGFDVVRIPDAEVVHLGGSSQRAVPSAARRALYGKSLDIYLRRAGYGPALRLALRVLRRVYTTVTPSPPAPRV